MRVLGAGLLRLTRGSLTVLLCALAAHAAAYGSLVPHDGVHGYVGVYDVVVGGLSALALLVVAASLAALLIGKAGPLRGVVASPPQTVSLSRRTVSLAAAAVAVLVAQETVERLVAGDPGEPVRIASGTWLVALVAIVLAAVVLVLLGACSELVRALLCARPALRRAPARAGSARRPSPPCRRRNSLADFRGLRAPPPLTA